MKDRPAMAAAVIGQVCGGGTRHRADTRRAPASVERTALDLRLDPRPPFPTMLCAPESVALDVSRTSRARLQHNTDSRAGKLK